MDAHLLMTRPVDASTRFVDELGEAITRRLDICFSPLLDIVPIATEITFDDANGVLFTSANGVQIASDLTTRRDLPCYSVGSNTTVRATELGWQAVCVGDTSEDMIKALMDRKDDAKLVHLSGRHTRGDIANRLSSAGRTVRNIVIYDQVLRHLTDQARRILAAETPVIVPIFSPRTARQFASQVAATAPIYVAALSKAVAEPLKNSPMRNILIAERPTTAAMKPVVERLLNQACRVEGDQGAQ